MVGVGRPSARIDYFSYYSSRIKPVASLVAGMEVPTYLDETFGDLYETARDRLRSTIAALTEGEGEE